VKGEDPAEERVQRRKALTVKELCDRYLAAADKGLILGKRGNARPSKNVITLIHENYMKIAAAGAVEGSGADVEGMRAIAQGCVRNHGVEAVLLGGTELSLAFQEADCGFSAFDCACAHLDAIISRAMGDIATN